MNNNQDVEDRIWGQVVCLNPPMIKKASEKVRGWNSETAQDMGLKCYGFLWSFARRSISYGFTPLDYFAWLEEFFLNKAKEMEIKAPICSPSFLLRWA